MRAGRHAEEGAHPQFARALLVENFDLQTVRAGPGLGPRSQLGRREYVARLVGQITREIGRARQRDALRDPPRDRRRLAAVQRRPLQRVGRLGRRLMAVEAVEAQLEALGDRGAQLLAGPAAALAVDRHAQAAAGDLPRAPRRARDGVAHIVQLRLLRLADPRQQHPPGGNAPERVQQHRLAAPALQLARLHQRGQAAVERFVERPRRPAADHIVALGGEDDQLIDISFERRRAAGRDLHCSLASIQSGPHPLDVMLQRGRNTVG